MVTLLNTVEDPVARAICADYGDEADALLEILHGVQENRGYLSDAALRTIAHTLNISRAEIHGVTSFYHDYKREPGAAVTIKICRAEACQAVGVNDLIAQAEAHFGTAIDAKSKTVALEAAYCLGNCALGPAIMVNDKLYGRADLELLKALPAKHGGSL